MTRVVVVGDLMTDTVARAAFPLAKGSDTPAAVTIHGGGSGANVASWLALEGIEVAFVGRRGSDIAGRNRDMELMGYGVDARLVMDQERPTGTCVVMVTHKGDRTMLSDPGANAALLPEDIERCKDLFSQGTHLHLSGYSLINEGSRKAAIHTLELARQANMSVSVDGGSSSPLKRMGAEPFLEWTQGARLLVVTGKEAEILTGRENPAAAAKVLTAWYPQVVIKVGADGALWYTNGRPEPVTVAAEPVEKVVDGTGAGDAFVAGFLPPWLDGKQPADALTAGCHLAAQATQHLGARPSLDVVDNQIK
ncbi:carbohydrate kinase family protein [Actinomadura sp. NTSP31]|uniref:carbohydrate kinase family protein n=1 Tax=Actinomadura sp. NTSP31 TaxID=1735447 RepID=UPI0035BEF165